MAKVRPESTCIFAFVGPSGAGKTTLLRRLIVALRRRGRSVAVVKHCSRGFDLGPADKDSSLLLEAGASGVALVGPGRTAIISRSNHKPSDREVAAFLGTVDFVFIEGGSAERDLPKVEILRRGVSENLRTRGRDLRAVVADFPVSASCPTFHLDETKALVEMLEKLKPAGHGTRRR